MRRWRALYFLPLFVVLNVAAIIAGYKLLLVPEIENVKKARAGWETERTAMESSLQVYKKYLDDQVKYSQAILTAYNDGFTKLQAGMPPIANVNGLYPNKKDALAAYYRMMGQGYFVRELSKWARGYKLANTPTFSFDPNSTLPFEDGLPDTKIVNVDFGRQRFKAKTLQELVGMIQNSSGYKYYPLAIKPVEYDAEAFKPKVVDMKTEPQIIYTPGNLGGGQPGIAMPAPPSPTASSGSNTSGETKPVSVEELPAVVKIVVTPPPGTKNRYKPRLEMDYAATGYFMATNWDPLGTEAATLIDTAKDKVANNPKAKATRTAPPIPCPKVLWVIDPKVPTEPTVAPALLAVMEK